MEFTFAQRGAFASVLVLAIGGALVLGINVVTLSGAMDVEIIYFGTVVTMLWVLVFLYGKRVRWSYVYGVGLLLVGFFGGLFLAMWSHLFYFSVSLYNLSIISLYSLAAVCLYFSYRSYRERPRLPPKRSGRGIGGTVLLTVVVGVVLWSNAGLISGYMLETNLQRIDAHLQTVTTLDDRLQYLMAEGNVPSLVAGIVVNDALVWSRGYGGASPETVYLIGSITKPFVATAILQLYERSLIDLDADVNQYIPFTMRHPQYPNTPITIRMLLSHRSGLAHHMDTVQYRSYVYGTQLRDWLTANGLLTVVQYDPLPSFREFLEGYVTPEGPYYSPSAWTAAEPGTAYYYSSPGYDVLGYIVERVSNQPFVEYLQENILTPLNMTSTGFSVAAFPENQAVPFERVYGVLSKTNVEVPLYDANRIGGGGMRSTVPDLAQFLLAHMNHGQINGVQLLKPATVELMHEPTVTFPSQSLWVGYGYGWLHLSNVTYEHHYFHGAQGHGGENWGFRCHMWFVEKLEGAYGIILMTNIFTNYKPDPIYHVAIDKIQDVLLYEASVRYSQTPQD